MRRFRKRERGMVLIATIVALVVCTSVLLAVLSSSLRSRRQLRTELQLTQTGWVLDAGVRRGLEQLKIDPEFRGEKFVLESGGNNVRNKVTIRVDGPENPNRVLEVIVVVGDQQTNMPVIKRSTKVYLQ